MAVLLIDKMLNEAGRDEERGWSADIEEKLIVECGCDAGAIPLGFSVGDRIRFCILQCLGNFQRGSVGHPELGRGEHPRGGILPRHASTRASLPAGPVLVFAPNLFSLPRREAVSSDVTEARVRTWDALES